VSDEPDSSRRRGTVIGGLAAVTALLLVVGSVQAGLSITVRVLALFALVVALFGVAVGTGREESLTYLTLMVYLASALYALAAFAPGRVLGAALVPVVLVVLLVGVYVLHERLLSPTPWMATFVAPAAVSIVVAVAIVDLQGGGVAYELQLQENVTVESEELTVDTGDLPAVVLGTATAETTLPLRQPASFPDAEVCLYTDDGRTSRSMVFQSGGSFFHQSVPAFGTLSADASALLGANETASVDGSVPVERAEACPDDAEPPRIVVVPDEGWS